MRTTLLILTASTLALHAGAVAQEREDAKTADEIVVYGSQVALTGTYGGDQVARGARAGLLGNLDYLDTPFSSTAYTEALLRQQQAISIGDALQNDPTVQLAKGFGNFQEVYVIRGFPVYSDDLTFNGVYGILPRQFVAAEIVERVEVFRGANAFLNGAAPGGSGAGGLINLVPKRAGEDPLGRVSLGYVSDGQVSGAADVSTRFGEDDAFGLRFNVAKRSGELRVEDQERDLTVLSLNTDYEGERFRLTADLGYQDNRIDAPRPQVTPLGAPPPVPGTDANYAQPWTYTDEAQLFGAVRGELDLTDAVTAWAAFGGRDGREANVLANPTATEEGLTTANRFDNTREDRVLSADAGVRADFETGPVSHRLTAAVTAVDLKSKNAFAFAFSSVTPGNLYEPNDAPIPQTDFLGGVLSDPGVTEESETVSYALADTLSLAEGRLLATVGLRYQQIETRSFDYTSGDELSGYDEEALTPSAGVVFKPTDGLALFANYAENLRPGQIAPATSGGVPVVNAGEVLDPFRGEQVEAGAKYDGGGFGGTLSVFTLNQPQAIVDADGLFTDGGETRSRGVELVVYGEPAPDLSVVGGLTYLDAELEETQGGLNEGNRPIGVPEFQATLTADYALAFLPGLSVNGRVIHTADQATNAANTFQIDGWTRLDLGARYELDVSGRTVAVTGRLENVTDDGYWASTGGFPGANYLVQGDPRSVLVNVSLDL